MVTGETGLDNSPLYDQATYLLAQDAVDTVDVGPSSPFAFFRTRITACCTDRVETGPAFVQYQDEHMLLLTPTGLSAIHAKDSLSLANISRSLGRSDLAAEPEAGFNGTEGSVCV